LIENLRAIVRDLRQNEYADPDAAADDIENALGLYEESL
jgi:hypothetical protein